MAEPDPAIASPAPLAPSWRERAGIGPPDFTLRSQRPPGVWNDHWIRPSTRRFGEF